MDSVPLVLMYHSVTPYDDDPFQVTVTPSRFADQMRWLARRGYRGTSVRELLEPTATGSPPRVGLTFDDGYQDFFTEALPVLSDHGFTATVLVVAERLGGDNRWDHPGPRKALMTAEQIRAVAGAGIEIGSHGLRHARLPPLDEPALLAEVFSSRRILEEVTGQPISGFGYPYGDIGEREVAAVRAAGYDYGCAVNRSPLTGRYALPRTYVGDRDGSLRLLAKWARHRFVGVGAR
jgi:peptidoglycan/xylan/chitin deacetylase (PgdA/CDA1 family)